MLEVNRLLDAQAFLLKQEVVLFDMDDTLYSEKEYVRSGYRAISENHPEISNMEEKLWDAFKRGEKAIDSVLQEEEVFSSETAMKCLEIYRSHAPKITLYPDAKKLLENLRKNGTQLGMITDGRPEGQRAKIKALGIEKCFEKIIITDELGGVSFRKPNTIAFEKMREHFNVPYEAMVYIGDNLRKDFIAPTRLGMKSVYFKNPEGLYSSEGR